VSKGNDLKTETLPFSDEGNVPKAISGDFGAETLVINAP
jgi:hypothetical protein